MSSEPVVYHKDKHGVLHPHDHKTTETILAAAATGRRFVRTGSTATSMIFDLKGMKQLVIGRAPFDDKEIVIEIPWNATSMKAASSFKADDSVRRKILEMAIDRMRAEESLRKILDLKNVPYRSIRVNPYLGRGHSPYDNFVESLLNATSSSKSGGEALSDAILDVASECPTKANLIVLENQGLRLVFHGTNEASMDSILKTGLLPQFRKSGNLEWFGVQYTISLDFTRRHCSSPTYSLKLLLFMVLHPTDSQSSFITSASNLFQLPLAEITLDSNLQPRRILLENRGATMRTMAAVVGMNCKTHSAHVPLIRGQSL